MGRVEVDTGCVDVCFSSLGQVCRRFLISVSDVYPYPHVILFFKILLDRPILAGFTSRERTSKSISHSNNLPLSHSSVRGALLSEARSSSFSCNFSPTGGGRVTRRRPALSVLLVIFLLFDCESEGICCERRITAHWRTGQAKTIAAHVNRFLPCRAVLPRILHRSD